MSQKPPESKSSPDDNQRVEVNQKTIAVATAVADLVAPVKQVLRGQRWLLRTMAVGFSVGLISLAGAAWVVFDQLRNRLDQMGARIEHRLGEGEGKVDKVDRKLDERPQITIRPADTADPSSRPALVIKTPPVSSSSSATPTTASVEIPLDVPPAKKE